MIIDLDAREQVDFYAADATTRLDVGAAFIAGAGSASYVTQIDPSQTGADHPFPSRWRRGVPARAAARARGLLRSAWKRSGAAPDRPCATA